MQSSNNCMHSDSKKRRSFLALLFAAGDARRYKFLIRIGVFTKITMITPSQIDKILTIAEHYAKSRPLNRISASLIAAGVSILGIENFFPYFLLAVRPELKNLIDLQNNTNIFIALSLIIAGVLVLPIGLITKYCANKFRSDVLLFESICDKYPEKSLNYIIEYFATNLALPNKHIDALDAMVEFVISQNLIIYDEKMSLKIKDFWRDLKIFRQFINLNTYPLDEFRVSIPREKRTDLTNTEVNDRCKKITESYENLYRDMIQYRHKSRLLKYII